MTYEQFLGWVAYAERNPWGPLRDDLRMEVFRLRLLSQLLPVPEGETRPEPPSPLWPYFDEEISPSDALAMLQRTEAHLERLAEVKRAANEAEAA